MPRPNRTNKKDEETQPKNGDLAAILGQGEGMTIYTDGGDEAAPEVEGNQAEERKPFQAENVLSPERKQELDELCAIVNKEYGAGALMRLGDPTCKVRISTTSSGTLTLDVALGGGLPEGRWIEYFGDKSSGKTTLAILHCIEVLRKGRQVVYIDGEHALNPAWATMLGLDINQLLIHQPTPDPVTGKGGCIEDVYNMILRLARTGKVGLIVIDSLPSIPSRAEMGGDEGIDKANFDDQQVAAQARRNSQASRMLTATLSKNKCTVLVINQNRDKIGGFSRFGTPKQQTGGNALQYANTIKVEVKNAEFLKPKGSGDEAKFIGQVIKCSIVKNKIAAPYKEATFRLFYEHGIDRLDELYQMGKYLNIIQGSTWMKVVNTDTGEIVRDKLQGEAKTKDAILNDPELYQFIYEQIMKTVKPDESLLAEEEVEEPIEA